VNYWQFNLIIIVIYLLWLKVIYSPKLFLLELYFYLNSYLMSMHLYVFSMLSNHEDHYLLENYLYFYVWRRNGNSIFWFPIDFHLIIVSFSDLWNMFYLSYFRLICIHQLIIFCCLMFLVANWLFLFVLVSFFNFYQITIIVIIYRYWTKISYYNTCTWEGLL